MEATYIWASIQLACSIVIYIVLISKILHTHGSWKTTPVWLGVMAISSVQLIITSIQLSVILINGQGDDWCFVNHVILYNLTQWEIYILFSCLILMTANFHQRLVNLTSQEYEGQHGSCSRPILGIGIAVVCGIGIFLLGNVRRIYDCNQLHQESQQLQNNVLFVSSVVALLIINFLVCYHCFTTEHSVLTCIENLKLIPNIRRSVIGLCIQNISFVILCYPWCVLQIHMKMVREDMPIPFLIYCLKSIVLPLVWTVFPELIPNLAMRLCWKKNDKKEVYLTTIYREYQWRKTKPMRVWSRSKSYSRASSKCLYLNPVCDEPLKREEFLNSDSHSDSENFYESINSLKQTNEHVCYEPYRHPSSDLKSSDSSPSTLVQSTSAAIHHNSTDNCGGREVRPSTIWTQLSSTHDSPTPCVRTHSKIVNGYLIPINVYEDVV